MSVIDELNKQTYVVEHSPNCPRRFLVRLRGKDSAVIDKKMYHKTRDILGFGDTLEEAAQKALDKKEDLQLT